MQRLYRKCTPAAPEGRDRFRWYGPGLLWMLSAVGTGSILFTPRVAAAYEYGLFWLLLLVVFFMWIMIREMARYSIVTGQSMLEGMYILGGPKGWAVWFIVVPQLLAAAVGIAGLSGVVGSALQSVLPGGASLYAIILIALSTFFVATGKYSLIERASRAMALVLMLTVVVAAFVVSPDLGAMAAGLAPSWPGDSDLYITAFLVLGAELLAPEGGIPKGTDVAVDLTRLFSDVWGAAGEYVLLAAIVIALGDSALANQDGWGRSFADITLILTRDQRERARPGAFMKAVHWLVHRTGLQ